jgi:hypothetical protein
LKSAGCSFSLALSCQCPLLNPRILSIKRLTVAQ